MNPPSALLLALAVVLIAVGIGLVYVPATLIFCGLVVAGLAYANLDVDVQESDRE